MTDDKFTAWLADQSAIRVVLIEAVASVGGIDKTFYMSTKGGYNTGNGDVPPNEAYKPIASVGVLYTEQLALNTGSASLAAGDVNIQNHNGQRDDWLGYIWTNRPVRAYIGDPRWPRADFRLIFNGLAADLKPDGRNGLSLQLRDKMQRLNTPITDKKLGGATPNKDALIPLSFGECHNVTPLLVDPATLRYKVHDGAIEDVIEVRDNGVKIDATKDLAKGEFTLSSQSFGMVTASVQGDKENGSYGLSVAQLVKRIVKGYGKATDAFTDADIDLANFNAFDAANPQPLGRYVPERENVIATCQALAGSVGAQLVMSRLGLLRLMRVDLPAPGVAAVVKQKHMVQGTLVPVDRTTVVGAVKIGFNKNYTVEAGLVTDIPEEHRALYAEEWLTTTKTDAATQAAYKLDSEPTQEDTMLLRRIEADAEATRRLNLWKVPRTVYEFEGTPEMLMLELGQPLTVYHPRYGMKNGVTAMVVSLAPDWLNGHVKVRFIV